MAMTCMWSEAGKALLPLTAEPQGKQLCQVCGVMTPGQVSDVNPYIASGNFAPSFWEEL